VTRRPGFVYAEGEDPDYRFSFANERTFLAWVRTSLALLAGGVAVEAVDVPLPDPVRRLTSVALLLLGLLSAVLAWVRWALAERALRRAEPLPSLSVASPVALGLALVAVVLLVTVLVT
jgi:putative membrane protein